MTGEQEHEPLMGVVLVNYASSSLLEVNLSGRHFAHSRIIVVDNFSSKDERHTVAALAVREGWTLVEQSDNRGFGAGVNAGAEAALALGCTSVLLLNPDLQVEPAVVESLRVMSTLDQEVLVAPRLVDPEGRTVFEGHILDLGDGRIRNAAKRPGCASESHDHLFWLTAACLAVNLELWHRLSGFDEGYFMYWEDVDFAYRAHRAGGRMVLRSDLVAVHDQGGTQGERRGRAKSPLYYRYNIRNRMVFASRLLTRALVIRWLVRTPVVAYEVWLHGGRRQLWETPLGVLAAGRGAAGALAVGLQSLARRRKVTAR